jgi:A/G-specific adenine glycosylase
VDEVPAAALVEWHRATRRAFPFRTPLPREPWAVLVSEVMAQQTQIDRVVPYWERFMARFPTVEALAGAPEGDVLELWSGLGYYRRARSLQEAARAIVEHGWPRTARELAALPGIGPYTAAAVAAFCFGDSEPPVDGNVARVAARIHRLALPLGDRKLLVAGRELLSGLSEAWPAAEVFEAVMELGATLCSPSSPRCLLCPLRPKCEAAHHGDQDRYPLPRPQRSTEDQRWVAIWVEREDGRVLLRQVQGPLLAGLWLPPLRPLAEGDVPRDVAGALASGHGFAGRLLPCLPVEHGITHRRITVLPFLLLAEPRAAELPPDLRWAEPGAPGLATSSLLGKLMRVCRPA